MLMFILGVLTMSLFTSLWCIFGDTENDHHLVIMGGPIMWALALFNPLNLIQWFIYHNRRGLLYNSIDNQYYYCKRKDFDYFYNFNGWSWSDHEHWDKDVDKWGKRFITLSPTSPNGKVVSMRYAPKSVWKNLPPVPAEEVAAAKAEFETDYS